MTGWLFQLFSGFIWYNSKFVFIFDNVCIPLAEIVLHLTFSFSVLKTQWLITISDKLSTKTKEPSCLTYAWHITESCYPIFFMINYKTIWKIACTFDKFSLLAISPLPSISCSPRDISLMPTSSNSCQNISVLVRTCIWQGPYREENSHYGSTPSVPSFFLRTTGRNRYLK